MRMASANPIDSSVRILSGLFIHTRQADHDMFVDQLDPAVTIMGCCARPVPCTIQNHPANTRTRVMSYGSHAANMIYYSYRCRS